jgi:hypothetical protein
VSLLIVLVWRAKFNFVMDCKVDIPEEEVILLPSRRRFMAAGGENGDNLNY